jgi:hypothetical protein
MLSRTGFLTTLLVSWACLPGASPSGAAPAAWFTDITKASGLEIPAPSKAYSAMDMPDIMCSGVALHDFDGDGDLDVYFTNCTWFWREAQKAKAPAPTNRYFRQEAGGKFVDATKPSGLAQPGFGCGVAVADYDNDGDLDLFAANYGPDRLFRNRGDGTFEDVSKSLNIQSDKWSCSAAFFDADNDGFLDLSINQYVDYDSTRVCKDPTGRSNFCGPKEFLPLSDVLLHNNGNGTFTDVSSSSGMRSTKAAALGVICEDFNADGRQDIYVANDTYANNMWINRGGLKFVDDALILGCAFNALGQAEAGMGVVAADLDRDLDLDIFLTHLRNEHNTVYVNQGAIGFEDGTASSGLGGPSMPFTGFGTAAFDAELDGDLDLFVANGAIAIGKVYEGCRLGEPWKFLAEPKHLYLGDGRGKFQLLPAAESGPLASQIEISRGTAAGDIDGDGDLDLVVSNIMSPSRLYRNDAPRKGHWLIVRAVNPKTKRDEIGSTITVKAGSMQHLRTISSSWSYLSSSEPRAHFGLGQVEKVDSILVTWPDGKRERFPGGPVDRNVELIRGKGRIES